MSRELHEKVHHSIREIGLDEYLKRSPECSCGLRFKRAEYLAEHQIEALRAALREVETPSPTKSVNERGMTHPDAGKRVWDGGVQVGVFDERGHYQPVDEKASE